MVELHWWRVIGGGLPRLVTLSVRGYKVIFYLDNLGNCNCKLFCYADKDFKNSKLQGDSTFLPPPNFPNALES